MFRKIIIFYATIKAFVILEIKRDIVLNDRLDAVWWIDIFLSIEPSIERKVFDFYDGMYGHSNEIK